MVPLVLYNRLDVSGFCFRKQFVCRISSTIFLPTFAIQLYQKDTLLHHMLSKKAITLLQNCIKTYLLILPMNKSRIILEIRLKIWFNAAWILVSTLARRSAENNNNIYKLFILANSPNFHTPTKVRIVDRSWICIHF